MIPRRRAHILKGEFLLLVKFLFKNDGSCAHYIKEWEEEFANYIGVNHAITVSSGRAGMELILRALQLNKGDEVIIPAYTLKDLAGIIKSLGLVAVPADIDNTDFNISPGSVTGRITERTKAILATHIFGSPCRIDRIMDIAKKKSIFVIEDCAHSLGAEFNGRKTGSFGDAAFFSFEAIKPVNAYGGGMVATNNGEIAVRLRRLTAGCGARPRIPLKKIFAAFLENLFLPTPLAVPFLYLLASPGWNEKIYRFYRLMQRPPDTRRALSGFQAYVAMEKLKTLDKRAACRRSQADLFRSLLKDNIRYQEPIEGAVSNRYFFVALLPVDPVLARKSLLKRGIDAGISREVTDDCAAVLGYPDCLNAQMVFRSAIQLPLYEGLPERRLRYMAATLKEILGENSFN